MRINECTRSLQENLYRTDIAYLLCLKETNANWSNQKQIASSTTDTFQSTFRVEDPHICINKIKKSNTIDYHDDFSRKKIFPQIDENRKKIINKLKSYQLYTQGWDGYDGVVPLTQAILDAINFLEKLPENCLLPYVSLSGDGEIGFFWETGNIFIDVGFLGDHTFSYFARGVNNEKYFGDDILLSNNLPDDLLQVIYSAESTHR